jgi:hypothetical protein
MALTEPPPTWLEALKALPPSLRLEVQRGVASDVALQASKPPAQAPFSRAYASNAEAPPPTGLGVYRSVAPTRASTGGHVTAVSRSFPSTAGLLAGLLSDAARASGVPLAAPPPPAAPPAAPLVAPEPALEGFAEELRAAGLDAAYRSVLAHALARRLCGVALPGGARVPGDPAWPAQAAACPAAARLLGSGELAAAAAAKVAAAQHAAAAADLD